MMKKSLFILVLLFMSQIQANVLDVSYKVSFGVFGKLGISDAHLETTGDKYTIDIKMKATGLAKTLSKNRKERHVSKGHIVNGLYVSDSYTVVKSYGKKHTEKRYTIDHNSKQVKKEYLRTKNGKIEKDEHTVLDFYSENDLLTLYFNLSKMIKERSKPGTYAFSAVGAERQKGRVEVYIPKESELEGYKKTLGEGEYWYMTAVIYQKIFASNKGELMLAVGKDGITQKAVLKDLMMFGDLVAERIR
ncbi:MAG: DUF3108 domain-containing protein [Sulfurovum sp.]|nr:DUF3108 domain-containing protein [Sulfurovum sp.]